MKAAKAKSKAEKDNVDPLAALDLSALDHVDVTFEAGAKLGLSIEKACVSAVAAGGAAEALKVFVFAHSPISPICRTPLFPYLTFYSCFSRCELAG